MQNANPTVASSRSELDLMRVVKVPLIQTERDPLTSEEVFDLIRRIRDPEHENLTLEQLRVAVLDQIHVVENDDLPAIRVHFTPTIPHCSMATLIGLCLSVKLLRSLPPRYKLNVSITPGTHVSEAEINKQLNDKERVAAALENPHLLKVVNKCIANSCGHIDDVEYEHDDAFHLSSS